MGEQPAPLYKRNNKCKHNHMTNILYEHQPRFKLTKKMLDEAKPRSIIHVGSGFIEHPWFNDAKMKPEGNLEADGRSVFVNFVVARGVVNDWCIYHSLDANLEPADYFDGIQHLQAPPEVVRDHGAKLYSVKQICSLIDCDDEVLKLYRV